jgi:hypothetical protein
MATATGNLPRSREFRAGIISGDRRPKEIEVYNQNGDHMGVMDPLTGQMVKLAVRGRTIPVHRSSIDAPIDRPTETA